LTEVNSYINKIIHLLQLASADWTRDKTKKIKLLWDWCG